VRACVISLMFRLSTKCGFLFCIQGWNYALIC